jgi:dTDP-4-dehydrorhamnose reductase
MRVAVVGAAGQLGAAIAHEFASAHDVIRFDRAALDLTRPGAVDESVGRAKPDVIVNCAAYNAVDAAEDHQVEALQVNAVGVRALARAARARDAMLVHFSSDFVFDGKAESPYTEEDSPRPQSVYAASKLLGEWFVAGLPRTYVLRVESLFGRAPGAPASKGSLAAIVSALATGGRAKVFEDRTVSPTYVLDAARATRQLAEGHAPAGLYHCVNSGHGTWLDVALEAARLIGVEPRIERVRFSDVRFRAVRPKYCALSNRKLASVGIGMPTWQDALARHLQRLRDDPADQAPDRQA